MLKRWTYKVRELKNGTLMKKLEEYGKDGWEAFKIEGPGVKGNYVVYMKRIKEEDED